MRSISCVSNSLPGEQWLQNMPKKPQLNSMFSITFNFHFTFIQRLVTKTVCLTPLSRRNAFSKKTLVLVQMSRTAQIPPMVYTYDSALRFPRHFLRLLVFRCLCRGNFAPSVPGPPICSTRLLHRPRPRNVHHDCLLVGFRGRLADCCIVDALQWVSQEIILQHTFSLEGNPLHRTTEDFFILRRTKKII